MDIQEKKRSFINRPVIALLVSLASTVGLAPFLLTVARPLALAYFAIGTLLLALVVLPRKTNSTQPPGIGEYVLAGLGAIFYPALLGLLGLVIYGLIYGLSALVGLAVTSLDPDKIVNPDPVAFYATIVIVAILLILVTWYNGQNITTQLYSKTAGLKSAMYQFIARRGQRLAIGIATAALILVVGIGLVIFFTHRVSNWWANLVVLIYLGFSTVFLHNISDADPLRVENLVAVQVLQKLFEAKGFEVVLSPRTGREEVDPLLVSLEMFARKGRQAYAVEVRIGEGEPDFSELTNMANMTKTAAWALEENFQRDSTTKLSVQPVLVFIGFPRNAAFRKWERTVAMKTLVFPDPQEVLDIQTIEETSRLKKAASQYLGLIFEQVELPGSGSKKKDSGKG